MLTYSASSSVYLTCIVSGRAMSQLSNGVSWASVCLAEAGRTVETPRQTESRLWSSGGGCPRSLRKANEARFGDRRNGQDILRDGRTHLPIEPHQRDCFRPADGLTASQRERRDVHAEVPQRGADLTYDPRHVA